MDTSCKSKDLLVERSDGTFIRGVYDSQSEPVPHNFDGAAVIAMGGAYVHHVSKLPYHGTVH